MRVTTETIPRPATSTPPPGSPLIHNVRPTGVFAMTHEAMPADGSTAALPPTWLTRISQIAPPVETEDCMTGWLCCHCAAAKAKADLDGSSCCRNAVCWNIVGVYSWVRRGYGIPQHWFWDLMGGLVCPCCAGVRSLTETRQRGRIPLRSTIGPRTFITPFFGCHAKDFLQACFCPCRYSHDVRKNLQRRPEGCHYDIQQLEHDQSRLFDTCCINPMVLHGEVRHMYNLGPVSVWCGSTLDDWIIPVFCLPCAVVQAKSEALARSAESVREPHFQDDEVSRGPTSAAPRVLTPIPGATRPPDTPTSMR